MDNTQAKIKVGFAFSGASSRSIFYIGFLEVLKEHDFPIDYIAALSGATIVASSFACGSLPQLKELALGLNKEIVFGLIDRSKGKGGLYSLSRFEQLIRLYTKNRNFEDVSPKLGFIATDLTAGEEVVLQVGDIAKAITASCTLPVVFAPMPWGNKLLVDGGVITVVPGNVARSANVDIVIGIDLRATRHVFSKWQIMARRIINKIRSLVWPKPAQDLWQSIANKIQYSNFWQDNFALDEYDRQLKDPKLFSVINRSLDIAIEAQQSQNDPTYNCDLLISPELSMPFWKKALYLRFIHFGNNRDYYLAGRQSAKEHLPEMWQLLKDKEQEKNQQEEKLQDLFIKN